MSNTAKKSHQDKLKTAEKAGEIANKIWLAGLGAYGKAFAGASEQIEKMNGKYEKVSKETTQLFDELVAKGKKLDSENHDKLSEVKSKTTSTIEDRINKVRSSLHFSPGSAELSQLSDKVDALTAKVDALLDAMGEGKKASAKSRSSAA
jgi:poly(hydroxyalkanoate) granule-associated protein